MHSQHSKPRISKATHQQDEEDSATCFDVLCGKLQADVYHLQHNTAMQTTTRSATAIAVERSMLCSCANDKNFIMPAACNPKHTLKCLTPSTV